MKFIKQNILLLIVFVTGACVLVIEITALRILSPYFGNTIYTSSSVISVILAALSLGYYFGGKLADKRPERKVFYFVIFASGLSTLLTYIVYMILLPTFSLKLSLTLGPFISALVLFTIPAFLLGMLSPYVIKLQEISKPKVGIGTLSGQVFFYSTLGSIVGSLLTGFFLIPNFGISQIIISTGLLLTIIGFMGFGKNLSRRNSNLCILIISFVTANALIVSRGIHNSNVVYSKDGIYERIEIKDVIYKDKPSRILFQDLSSSSGIYLDSQELTFEYTKYYELYKLFDKDVKRALILGGGAYTIPNALVNENESISVDVVDIEPDLYKLATEYFQVRENPRITSYQADARRFLIESEDLYDYIFSDVYSSVMSIPSHLTTKEFFETVKSRLTKDGIFMANVMGAPSRVEPNLFLSKAKTILSVFPNSYFFAVNSAYDTSMQNIIFLSVNGEKKLDDDRLKEFLLEGESKGIYENIINIERFDFSNQLILTDNYSPVEAMVSRNIKLYENNNTDGINAKEALQLIKQQVKLGGRYVGSNAHLLTSELIISEMSLITDESIISKWNEGDYTLRNLIFRLKPEIETRLIIATHYDSKKIAIDKQNNFVPGANDSASGTALIIELARLIRTSNLDLGIGIDYVFFDGEEGLEDNANGFKPLGSQYFADNINSLYSDKLPYGAIVLDMVCDKNLKLYKEKNSLENASNLTNEIWGIGQAKYPNEFIRETKYDIIDDHTSLNSIGIPSVLIIDFDYPHFHKTTDTPDKCSEESLEIVGNTLLEYIKTKKE